jgi:hypothetical protein
MKSLAYVTHIAAVLAQLDDAPSNPADAIGSIPPSQNLIMQQ